MSISFFSRKNAVPIEYQQEATECGLASLSMCFRHLGLDTSISLLRQKYPVGQGGLNMNDLANICQNEGMVGDVYQLEIEHMPDLPLPAILHWDLSHFVVLTKVSKKGIVIHDPGFGKRMLDYDELGKHFSGYAISISRGKQQDIDEAQAGFDEIAKKAIPSLSFRTMFTKTHGLLSGLFGILILMIIIQALTLLFPLLTQTVIDNFVSVSSEQYLLAIIAGGAMVAVFLFVLALLQGWASIHIGYQWHSLYASYFFQRVTHLPMKFFEARSVADVSNKFRVLDKLKAVFSEQLVNGVISGLMAITTIITMFIYSPSLGSISILFFVIYLCIRIYLIRKETYATGEHFTQSVKETHVFYETVENIQSIKLFGNENKRYQRYKSHYLAKMKATIKLQKLELWYLSSNNLLGQVERLVVLYIGAMAIINGSMTLGMFFAYIAYREIFASQSKSLVDNVLMFNVLKVDLQRLSDIETSPVEAHRFGIVEVEEIKGRIELKDISYRFPGAREDVLSNVDLSVAQGENLVITGPSGAGKSTLLNIMIGLHLPTKGSVYVDGFNLLDIGHMKYRENIAVISQQDRLIAGTILENIIIGDEKIDKDKLIEAATHAAILDDIRQMPMQFQTIVSGGGQCNLSGGQIQRILIARALYAKPTILFMDEATSALDEATEQQVISSLQSLNITRIAIAHRKETIEKADRVFSLKYK